MANEGSLNGNHKDYDISLRLPYYSVNELFDFFFETCGLYIQDFHINVESN